jgi:integrase/recombinase XerD
MLAKRPWTRATANRARIMRPWRLPALAAFIGQEGLGSTERYLHMTEWLRKQLDKLSPTRGKGRWQDNKVLLEFPRSLF